MNDWPPPELESVEAFISILRAEIGHLSKANVRKRMACSDPLTEAWKGEALAELLLAWEAAEEDVALDELVKRVTDYVEFQRSTVPKH